MSRHWQLTRAKHLFREIDEPAGVVDLPLLSVSIHHGVVPRDSLTPDEPRADDLARYKRVEPGDVVLNRMRAFQGGIGIAHQQGIVSPDYAVLRFGAGVDVRFFHHLFRSQWFVGEMAARLRGIGSSEQGNVRTPRINVADLGEIVVSVPSISDQHGIAAFLDAETRRIDSLIERKRHLARLLDDRRRAVIDGLTVPIALGGRADDGCLPWPVTSLKRSATFFTDGDWIESPFITEQGIRLIQTGNVGEGEYREQGFRFISDDTFRELSCTAVNPGDVLISRLAGPVGCACLAPNLGEPMIASVDVAIMRPTENVDPRFVVAYLSSARHLALAELLARGTTMRRLSRAQVGDLPLPVPPIATQRRVADDVERAVEVIREAKGALVNQISLIQEHRQALITAAVTGQLDIARAAA